MSRLNLREIKKKHPEKPENCQRCRWFLGCKSYKIPSRQFSTPGFVRGEETDVVPVAGGGSPKSVLLVAMNPGVDEDRQGKILVGRSGELLETWVEEFLSDYIVYVTNAVKCYAPKDSLSKDGALPVSQIKYCSSFLKEDIESIKPDAIVALGRDAAKALDHLDLEYTRCHHPSYVLHGGSDEYSKDMLSRVDAELKGDLVKIPYIVPIQDISRVKVIGLDFEWDYETGVVNTIGVATGTWCSDLEMDDRGIPYLKRILKNPNYTLVGHDLARAEVQKCLELGINDINCKFMDTFILMRELLDHEEDLALKSFAYRHCLIEDYTKNIPKGKTDKETKKLYAQYMQNYSPEVGRICAADAWTSLYVWDCLAEDWKEAYDSMKLAREVDMDMILPTATMMYKGIGLDMKKVEAHRKKLVHLVPDLKEEIQKEYGLDVAKTQQILGKLKEYGVTDTNKATLQKLLEEGKEVKFIEKVLEYRKMSKLVSTYLKPLPELVDSSGCIHSYIQIAGANNGRPTSSSPNISNIPRRGYNMKDIFCSKFGEDGVLATLDASESEFRHFAYLSQDKWLIEQYKNGVGMHDTLAKLTGISRDNVKTLNFARLYGASENKLGAILLDAGLSGDTLKKSLKSYHEATQTFTRWQKKIIRQSYDQGFVESPDGRRGHRLNPTEISNYPVSSFSSYSNKKRLVWLFREMKTAGLASHIWLDYYDGIELDIYLPELETVKEIVKDIPQTIEDILAYGIELPVPIDFKIHGRNWA